MENLPGLLRQIASDGKTGKTVVGKTLAVRGNAKCVQAIEVPTSAFHQETAAMPHHKSGCTAAIQPSCHHQRLLDQQGASMYGPLRAVAVSSHSGDPQKFR